MNVLISFKYSFPKFRFPKLERVMLPKMMKNIVTYCYIGMVASLGVLGFLKLSVRRDIITEDIL